MANQAARDASALKVRMDIDAITEALAMAAITAQIFDGAATRSAFSWTAADTTPATAKLAALFKRMDYFNRLNFSSLVLQLADDAPLATVKSFVQALVTNLANGADVAVVNAGLNSALARITALGG